jgi:hypothetical protein
MILPAQHRDMHEPVLKLVRELRSLFGARRIAVLVPQLIDPRWRTSLLHTRRAARLRARLLRCGDPQLTVIGLPWRLSRSPGEDGGGC